MPHPRALQLAIKSKANQSKAMRGVRITALKSLGRLKARGAGAEVERRIRERDAWVAKAAIDASAILRLKSSIDPLIKALRRVEGSHGRDLASLNPLSGPEMMPTLGDMILNAPQKAKKDKRSMARALLRKPILKALKQITRRSFTTSKEWQKWWRKSKAKFHVPD